MLQKRKSGHGHPSRGYATSIAMGLLALTTIASMALTFSPPRSASDAPTTQTPTSANSRDMNPGYSVTGEIDISYTRLPTFATDE